MARSTKETVFLVSSAGTGFFYSVRRKRGKEKLSINKYDPVARKHVLFQEKKLSKLKRGAVVQSTTEVNEDTGKKGGASAKKGEGKKAKAA